MRVISQDGMVDLPYENIGISINHNNKTDIIAYPACNYGCDSEFWIIASYSAEARAQKALEMLRNNYLDFMAEATPDGNGFCFNQPKVFRFPKDEDVEV